MAVCRCLLLGALPKTLRATDCFDEPWLRQTCDNLGQRSVHRSHVPPMTSIPGPALPQIRHAAAACTTEFSRYSSRGVIVDAGTGDRSRHKDETRSPVCPTCQYIFRGMLSTLQSRKLKLTRWFRYLLSLSSDKPRLCGPSRARRLADPICMAPRISGRSMRSPLVLGIGIAPQLRYYGAIA
ncbi:hypothetical protein BD309DRAFT_710624 [Dichomitus squalens]|nr:hypothetical protein BD309DRAFT_710624 [Dichomitus squalens]